MLISVNLFPKTNLDCPKSKEFVDGNFKVDENGEKFSKRVENNVGKGEIAHYGQFLLLPQSFHKTCLGKGQPSDLLCTSVLFLYIYCIVKKA